MSTLFAGCEMGRLAKSVHHVAPDTGLVVREVLNHSGTVNCELLAPKRLEHGMRDQYGVPRSFVRRTRFRFRRRRLLLDRAVSAAARSLTRARTRSSPTSRRR